MLGLFKAPDKSMIESTGDILFEEQKAEDCSSISKDGCAKVLSAANKVDFLYNSFIELNEFNNELDRLISCTAAYYWFFKEGYNISRAPKNRILLEGASKYEFLKSKNVKLLYNFEPEKFEEHEDFEFDLCIPGEENFDAGKVRYFQCLCNVQRDALECFMSADAFLSEHHCMEADRSIDQLENSFSHEFDRSKQLFLQFFSNIEDGVITELIRVYIEVKRTNIDAVAILELIDYITDKYKESVRYFEEKYGENLNVNFYKLNILLGSLKPKNTSNGIIETSSNEYIPAELEDSLDRILEFSNLHYEKIDFFKSQLEIFRNMDNKSNYEFVLPEIKNKITSVFFEIYEAVLKRVINENVNDRAIDMFLVFGFMDNSLLTNQQILALSKLLDSYTNEGNVYSMKRWLTKIYNSEKLPSINELGADYEQVLKERKARGRLTGNKAELDWNSGDGKLDYEINNMFKTNHKLCYGQISEYFPVLHSDVLPDDISRVAVTSGKINQSLLNILNVDFSAFHREVFYTGDNPAFKKELIMKQVIPDIILIPTIGTKAIMWQEMAGRSRLAPGRFIIPVFTWEDLDSLIIKLTGSFRWELCRAVMGVRWNDISYKSLTSEYADYIQDYRKNKNLSQENKEKIKSQIQRYHNNLRDIFSSDYEAWMRYEANGIRKVNKEVRTILYKYCPFKSFMREELIKQPAFSNIAAQFENERKKFAKELENRYTYYVKQVHLLEVELEENLRFYRDL